jgi:hypothetical protein
VIDGGVNLGSLPAVMAAGVLQARAMEGNEGGAGSLQEDDVVLMVPLIGAERSYISGSTGGRAAAEERGSPVLRSGGSGGRNWIGSLSELRWIMGVLFVLRIEDGERWWGLPTVSRSRGGGPVGGGDRSRENWMEKKCANARACTRGAREGARGPEEDVPMHKQELAPRRRSARRNMTWRTQGRASTGSGGQRQGG